MVTFAKSLVVKIPMYKLQLLSQESANTVSLTLSNARTFHNSYVQHFGEKVRLSTIHLHPSERGHFHNAGNKE